jgi:hypothetical protein
MSIGTTSSVDYKNIRLVASTINFRLNNAHYSLLDDVIKMGSLSADVTLLYS